MNECETLVWEGIARGVRTTIDMYEAQAKWADAARLKGQLLDIERLLADSARETSNG